VQDRPQIALLIESSRGYGRGLLHGIADYVRAHGPWSVYLQRHSLYGLPPRWLRSWKGDGVIARVENEPLARAITARAVPFVDLRGRLLHMRMPTILTDDAAGARLAAEHLLERGFRHFAFCGFVGVTYSDVRARAFSKFLQGAGHDCNSYLPPARWRGGDTEKMEELGLVYERHLADWLVSLPKPVGVMACNDARGQQVLHACRDVGIAVPQELAVIGVDNDDVICELCDPPLSSVVPNTRMIGFQAAALLQRLMTGAPPPEEPVVVPPLGVVARRSTDILAFEDGSIAAAVRYIREHACEGITVEDVLTQVPLSACALERHFHRIFGHTPKAEIVRVQVERVKQLLCETKLSLKEISQKAGFRHPEYMSVVFKEKAGQTPGQFRSVAQLNVKSPRGAGESTRSGPCAG